MVFGASSDTVTVWQLWQLCRRNSKWKPASATRERKLWYPPDIKKDPLMEIQWNLNLPYTPPDTHHIRLISTMLTSSKVAEFMFCQFLWPSIIHSLCCSPLIFTAIMIEKGFESFNSKLCTIMLHKCKCKFECSIHLHLYGLLMQICGFHIFVQQPPSCHPSIIRAAIGMKWVTYISNF